MLLAGNCSQSTFCYVLHERECVGESEYDMGIRRGGEGC